MNIEELTVAAQAGDATAMDKIIAKLYPSVTIVARLYKSQKEYTDLPLDVDDMAQIGSLAIMRAVNAYNPSEGNLFWTYAEAAVKNAITDYIRTAQKEKERFGEILSLDDENKQETSEKHHTPKVIPYDYSKNPEQIYIEKETREELHAALSKISDREIDYLRYRFGFDEKFQEKDYHNRTDTAHYFSLSNSRAHKLEELALDNIKLELPWWY